MIGVGLAGENEMIVSLLPKFNGIKIRITKLTHYCMDRNSVSEFPPVIPGKHENQKGRIYYLL